MRDVRFEISYPVSRILHLINTLNCHPSMILIIDDDKAVRASLLLLLQKEAYATKDVSSPNEAIAWLNHNTPSLIILDLNFSIETSGDEGMKLLKQIRKMYPLVPIILITGWADRKSTRL